MAVKATLVVRMRGTRAPCASALRGRGRRHTALPNAGRSVGLGVGLRASPLNGGEPGTIPAELGLDVVQDRCELLEAYLGVPGLVVLGRRCPPGGGRAELGVGLFGRHAGERA